MRRLAAGLAALAAATSSLLVGAPAANAAPSAASSDLVITGHGWGHRRGMGQWGALGYAVDHGWSSAAILDHFYGGTSASTVSPTEEITVQVTSQDGRALAVQVDTGIIATFTPGGAPVPSAGRAVRVEQVSGGFRLLDAPSCAGPWTARPGTVSGSELRLAPADRADGDRTVSFGQPGDIPLVGDWDGDGVDGIGVWRGGRFMLRQSATPGPADLVFDYGKPTDVPLVGDWDGDGKDTVGVRRGNAIYLRNRNSAGAADLTYAYGSAGDRVVTGDWNGDGKDTVGVHRGNQWLLRNVHAGGGADTSFSFGSAGDEPVTGDWDGDGRDGVGVRRGSTWHLRNDAWAGGAHQTLQGYGGGAPVTGRWAARTPDRPGTATPPSWTLAVSGAGGGAQVRGDDLPLERTLQLCHATTSGGWSSTPLDVRFYRGQLRAVVAGGVMRTINALGVDQYVRGVVPRESPATWGNLACTGTGTPRCGQAALEAQAVAARSYALAENRAYAKTCDTTTCQVYYGRAGRPAGGSTVSFEHANTDAAVQATAGVVRRWGDGRIVRTEFSSSTGGHTRGGDFPAVVDLGDSVAGNTNHTWTVTITGASLQSRYGQAGPLVSARVLSRESDGRAVARLELVFTSGRVEVTGEALRSALGLRSTWFDLAVPSSAQPDVPGVRRGNEWLLRTAPGGGSPGRSFAYGSATDVPVVGDWDGDGRDGVGVRRGDQWILRSSPSAGSPTTELVFGAASDRLVVGDWNGDGVDGVGVVSGNTWKLRDALSSGTPNYTFAFGTVGDVPVVGDWDGDGRDDPGVFRSGTFHLRTGLSGGAATMTVATGQTGTPVVGDWDGDGKDEVGVVSGNTWVLIRSLSDPSDRTTFSYGSAGDTPVPGRWG